MDGGRFPASSIFGREGDGFPPAAASRLEKCRDPGGGNGGTRDAFSVNVTLSIVCGPRERYAAAFPAAARWRRQPTEKRIAN